MNYKSGLLTWILFKVDFSALSLSSMINLGWTAREFLHVMSIPFTLAFVKIQTRDNLRILQAPRRMVLFMSIMIALLLRIVMFVG